MRRPDRSEDGFSVMEVMVVSALLLLITTGVFGVLISLQKTDRRVSALVSNEQETRFVMTELLRDIRAANPPLPFSTTQSDYSSRIEMMLGPSAGPQQRIRWVYNTNPLSPDYQTLKRERLDAAGTVLAGGSSIRLRNVRNVVRTPAVPLFRYFNQGGVDLVTKPGGAGQDVGNCSVHVEVTITADSNPGPEPFTVRSTGEIRNRLPGGVGCG